MQRERQLLALNQIARAARPVEMKWGWHPKTPSRSPGIRSRGAMKAAETKRKESAYDRKSRAEWGTAGKIRAGTGR